MERRIDEYLIFQGIGERNVEKLLSQGITVYYDKDEVIFYEGSEGSQIYIILDGKIGIYKDDKLIGELSSGECVGEMGLFTKMPRSATAKSLTKTKLLILSENILNKVLHKKVAIKLLLNIITILSERIRELNEKSIPK